MSFFFWNAFVFIHGFRRSAQINTEKIGTVHNFVGWTLSIYIRARSRTFAIPNVELFVGITYGFNLLAINNYHKNFTWNITIKINSQKYITEKMARKSMILSNMRKIINKN